MARQATGRMRTKEIRFMVSDEELDIAKQKAEIADLPITQYLRKILVDGEVKVLPVDELKDVMKGFSEFNTIFNSVNSKIAYFQETIKDHHDDYSKSEMDEVVNNLNLLHDELNKLCGLMIETVYNMKN